MGIKTFNPYTPSRRAMTMLDNARNLKAALEELGFSQVYEVALGADIGAIAEAHHYVEKVTTGELPFLLTSCCPSWAMLAKKYFPDMIDEVSQELTPMVATARTIKKEHPNAKVVFIGPCAAKKLEAMRRSVRSDVDFVVTFEELQGMFDAKEIDLSEYEAESSFHNATGVGRGYAVAGGEERQDTYFSLERRLSDKGSIEGIAGAYPESRR